MQGNVGWKWKTGVYRRKTGCSTCKSSPQAAFDERLRYTKYLCISSLVLSPNIFTEYKSFYARKLMVEYLPRNSRECAIFRRILF
jgi:hypothetical protein